MLDAFVLDHVIFADQGGSIRIGPDEIGNDEGDINLCIKKDQIKNIEVFRSIRKYCLRIITETGCYDILNVDESQLIPIKQRASEYFGINLINTELETLNTTEGNLVFSNNILTLHSEKPVFSIPKNAIEHIVELGNEFQFHLKDVEIVLSTTSNAINFLKNKVNDEVCIVTNVNCVSPRSRVTLIFFETHFECRGSSYDHSIAYKDVTNVLFLETDTDTYLLLRLETPIVQGQTRYEGMVFSLDKKEIEVSARDGRLQEYYHGGQDEVVVEIIEKLIGSTAREAKFYIKCTNKVNDGYLFFMDTGLQFLPKPTFLSIEEIKAVEFSRIGGSVLQGKSFDMTVHGEKIYNFNSINKTDFTKVEEYFTHHGVKTVMEVIDEISSEESKYSDEESNISGIIDDADSDE